MRMRSMHCRTVATGVLFLTPFLLVACQAPKDSAAPTSRGYVSRPILTGAAKLIRPLAPVSRARLTIVLKPPHRDELAQLVKDQSDPNSSRFRQFLTYEEWKEGYAPKEADVAAVAQWAASQGLHEVHRFDSNQALVLEGDVDTIQRAFSVHMNQYEAEGRRFYANDRAPTVPAELTDRIADVVGLSSFEQVHAASQEAPSADVPEPRLVTGPFHVVTNTSADATPSAGARTLRPHITTNGLEPADIRSEQAYNYDGLAKFSNCCNVQNLASGSPRETSIAIIGNNKAQQSDYVAFFNNYGLAYNITEVAIDSPACCSQEMTMDVEWSVAMANSFGAAQKTAHEYVYEGGGTLISDTLDAWQQALSDNNARVASSSFGSAESAYGSFLDLGTPAISDFTDVTSAMVSQGWTLVVAAGDDGATADSQTTSVQYPASDPNVIAVGGTVLTMNGSSAATLRYSGETTWTGPGTNNNGGGAGGCSGTFWTPWWQGSIGGCPSSGAFRRAVPDISLNAGGGQVIYYSGSATSSGGTSIGAPELAGFFAQANSYLATIGLAGNICGSQHNAPCGPIGNAGPALYMAGQNLAAHNPFYDITTGCNGGVATFGYCAASGYDKATGWGSANMLQLAWAINDYINAPGSASPTIQWVSPPQTSTWYSTDQTLTFNVSGATMGLAGFTALWDRDPGDPSSHATPGSGDPFWDGPATRGYSTGFLDLAAAGNGCHTAYVRAWDNDGQATVAKTYGPLCYMNCSSGLGACGDSISTSEPSVSLPAADTTSVPINVTIGSCSPMLLSVSGALPGVSATLSQTSVNATSSLWLYLGLNQSVTPEQMTLTVTGTCGGGSAATTVQLTTLQCIPKTCTNGACGTVDDGCGHSIACGGCPTGETCAGNVCQEPTQTCSTPRTCCIQGGCLWRNGSCFCS